MGDSGRGPWYEMATIRMSLGTESGFGVARVSGVGWEWRVTSNGSRVSFWSGE